MGNPRQSRPPLLSCLCWRKPRLERQNREDQRRASPPCADALQKTALGHADDLTPGDHEVVQKTDPDSLKRTDQTPADQFVSGGDFGNPTGMRVEERSKLRSGLLPQRALPPLVPFTVQPHPRWRVEGQVLGAQIRDLLHAGAGVIEKQQQRPVAQCEPAAVWQSIEESLHLLPCNEMRGR